MLASTSEPVSQVRLAATLALGMGLGTVSQFILGALSPRITADLGMTSATFGLAVTGLFACGFLLAPLAGGIVDRVGGRAALVAVCLSTMTAMAGLALAADPWSLAIVALAGGAAMALANPATNRIVSTSAAAARRGMVVGVTQAGVQAAALVAGLLAAGAGLVGGWRGSATLLAVGAAAAAVVVARAFPRVDATRSAAATSVLRTRPAAATASVAGYALLMGAGAGAVFSHLPLYAYKGLGLSEAAAGGIPALFGVVGVLARISFGRYADRLVRTSPLLVGMATGAAVAIGLVALASHGGAGLLWAGAALFGVTGVAWPAVAMLTVVRTSGAHGVGVATGWVSMGLFGGLLLTPAPAGWLADGPAGYTAVWWAVAGIYLLAVAVALWWVAPGADRDAAATSIGR